MLQQQPLLLKLVFLLAFAIPALAETPPVVSQPSQLDREFMQQQRDRIDNLSREKLGRQLGKVKPGDLEILQALLDRRLVTKDQTIELQAMGIVMGDLLSAELGMNWVIYEDRYGRSRALRLNDSDNFLFPVTMISRRVEAGAHPNVERVYDKAKNMITPYITPLPFQ